MSNESYERYAKIRDSKELTDYKVAKLATLNGTATISNWKNGKYVPKADKMSAIAKVLECNVEDIIGKTDFSDRSASNVVDYVVNDGKYDALIEIAKEMPEERYEELLRFAKFLSQK